MFDESGFDLCVDVLVVGAGGGGMTAALRAGTEGLDTLLVEKTPCFGGSTALSGGGIWVPGASVQVKEGYNPDSEEVIQYLTQITKGIVSDERLRTYVETAPDMLDFFKRHTDVGLVWKPGYPDYFPEVPGGSARGSVINIEPMDLRKLGADEDKLLKPNVVAPKGMWLRPLELREFFRIRWSITGKLVLLRFLWRMLRARVLGERVAALGQALAAQLWIGLRRAGVQLWLDSPLLSLITDEGEVQGAVITHDGKEIRVGARGGVVLATGGFENNPEMRRRYQPFVTENETLGNHGNTGDGIQAGLEVGAAVDLMDEAWWFPILSWPSGRRHLALNERMMPGQFIVNGAGERFINEATPYSEFGHAMIAGQATGTSHMPCWLITDAASWNRYVIAGHLPLPHIPGAPAPTGRSMIQAWLDAGVVRQGHTLKELASQIGVPADALERTGRRYNELSRQGHDDDFGRGDSQYDRYFGDDSLPNPCFGRPVSTPPFYAFKLVLGDLGTNGGIVTDEHARALRADGTVIRGLYATGNTSAAVMGRTYAGAGATIGPAMTFGYVAATHIKERLKQPTAPAEHGA